MTLNELLARLELVCPRGSGRYAARCPAHVDKSPSLSILEGDKGILLKCWAGCTLGEISKALGLRVADFFFDARIDLEYREARKAERRTRDQQRERDGLKLDRLREAEQLIRSARGLDISRWSDDQLDRALNRLADAYGLIELETQQ